MEKVLVHDNQRGLLFRSGRFVKLLPPGRYRTFGDNRVEVLELEDPLSSEMCPLETLLADSEIARQVSTVEVADQQLALHFVDGKFAEALPKGKYAFWAVQKRHEYQMEDFSTPKVGDSVPRYIFDQLPDDFFIRVEVAQFQKARLYFDRKLEALLDPGVYFFWRTNVRIDVDYVDTRLTQLDVSGQEILTRDKVSLRISFGCSYRITDYVRVLTEIDDYAEQLHVAAQLALREFVGKYTLDEILDSKDRLSAYVLQRLGEKAPELFVEIKDGGVKDIILPGEIRDIMNTVLAAEKRAQASVITRREEVASTRSLLNTAKLMEENQTLYKLKEMEYIERICGNVGSINLNGGGDILAQLSGLLRGK